MVFSGAACWGEKSPCDLWAGKLTKGEEVQAAVQQLRAGQCVSARPLLLDHMKDPGLASDVLDALVALGRSPEAESAIRRALSSHETVSAAAKQVGAWQLASAEPELRVALADPGLAQHHGELMSAALAVAPAARWVDELVREVGNGGASSDTALDALATIGWSDVPEATRARAVDVLTDVATRPGGGVTAARMDKVLSVLGAIDPPRAPAVSIVVERARAGDRSALLVLAALAHPETEAIAASLATRADVDRATRWLALALTTLGGALGPEAVATVSADTDVALGLALVIGPAVGPALAARRAEEKGAGRAALARAEVAVLPATELDTWRKGLEREASVLLRGLLDEPAVIDIVALTRRCGTDTACLVGLLDELVPRLATLDADRVAARRAVDTERAKADATTKADAERARALAQVTGDGVAEARVELEAIRARTAAAYAEVEVAAKKLDALAGLELQTIVALRRLDRSDASAAVARRVLDRAVGPSCATVRAWAVVAALGGAAHRGRERFDLVMRAR